MTRSRPAGQLRRVALDDPLVSPLLDGLTAEYEARYGSSGEMALAGAAEFEPPDGLFLVLVDAGSVVAGGGLRRLADGVCEVKRMWTRADRRRRGLAATVLDGLEDGARAAGYRILRLETGPAQPEAQALYTSRRYRPIDPYGHYPLAMAFELGLADARRFTPS